MIVAAPAQVQLLHIPLIFTSCSVAAALAKTWPDITKIAKLLFVIINPCWNLDLMMGKILQDCAMIILHMKSIAGIGKYLACKYSIWSIH